MKKTSYFLAMLALLATSCKDKDVFDETQNQNPAKVTEANTFDFCTSQLVKLNVDYSAYKTHGPVYFSVYSQNPFEESEEILSQEGCTSYLRKLHQRSGQVQ